MIRKIVTIAFGLLAVGCSTPPQMLEANASAPGIIAVATLAPAGSVEFQLAPAYTRNAFLRQRAAQALQRGDIDVATARKVLDLTDTARALLDAARLKYDPALVDDAKSSIDVAAMLLEVKP